MVLSVTTGSSAQTSGCYLVGESEAECTERGVRFVKWLMSRCASSIYERQQAGVVSHVSNHLLPATWAMLNVSVLVHMLAGSLRLHVC